MRYDKQDFQFYLQLLGVGDEIFKRQLRNLPAHMTHVDNYKDAARIHGNLHLLLEMP